MSPGGGFARDGSAVAEAEAEVGAALDEKPKGAGLAVVRGSLGGGAHLRGAYGARARVEGGDVAGVGLVQESAKGLHLTCRRELHDELTSAGLARAGERAGDHAEDAAGNAVGGDPRRAGHPRGVERHRVGTTSSGPRLSGS